MVDVWINETENMSNTLFFGPSIPTLPETKSSPLKMDGWNTTFLLGPDLLSGAFAVSFREIFCVLNLLRVAFGSFLLTQKFPQGQIFTFLIGLWGPNISKNVSKAWRLL